jgi:hypothetical protein
LPGDWSAEEVEATVAEYFAMLTQELRGEPVNKRAHNRSLQATLRNRSAGAIEFKHANISAVLIDLGYPYIGGYKPRSNYQLRLYDAVAGYLVADRALRDAAAIAVNQPIAAPPALAGWEAVYVPPPSREATRERVYERRISGTTLVRGINYLERESRNRSLGVAGEEYVLRLEHDRLWSAGAKRLAERVEHVAKTIGDGLGYDIQSFESDGRERLIEVKTTRFGAMTPIFASINEVDVSEQLGAQYHLYRLYRFELAPKLFVLPGSLRQSLVLEPIVYRASLP